ncbi:STAS domain-containing protein [Nocardioides sp.]|nr:STAS domain-containing protein [Nocardioides sp.]
MARAGRAWWGLGPAAHPWPHGLGRRGPHRRRDSGADASTTQGRRARRWRVTDLAHVDATTVDSTTIVRVRGEIDLSNAAEVRDAIGAAVPDATTSIVLDLSDTAYLDSAGIAMIFRLAERLGYNRQELRLVVPPDAPIRAVIRLTQMDRIIPTHHSVD